MKPAAGASNTVQHIPSSVVHEAFQQGTPLLKRDSYQIHASRRDGPGEAELHDRETDIFHILEGVATLVTGGEIIDLREIEPGQHRGTGIRNGETIKLRAGDVIIIPRGVPHWFQRIDLAPLVYYTVKVIDPA